MNERSKLDYEAPGAHRQHKGHTAQEAVFALLCLVVCVPIAWPLWLPQLLKFVRP